MKCRIPLGLQATQSLPPHAGHLLNVEPWDKATHNTGIDVVLQVCSIYISVVVFYCSNGKG